MTPQPIATAPKDGTWVLLGGGVIDDSMWEGGTPRWVAAKYLPEDDAWAFDRWDGDFRSMYLNPTHWIPMPDNP